MILFDIGANRGEVVMAGLQKGYDRIIALEPAPKMYQQLVTNTIYMKEVTPLKFAVSDKFGLCIDFYECAEDGLSTLNKDWLTSDKMRYNGKPYRTIQVNTCTIDWLAERYGNPDLIKIDVEGAEWSVFYGMKKKYGKITFEWVTETLQDHIDQLKYLKSLGYTEYGPQFITHHLVEPEEWFSLDKIDIYNWISKNYKAWEDGGWLDAGGYHYPANAGMMWVR